MTRKTGFWGELARDWGAAIAVVLGVWVVYSMLFGGGPLASGTAPDFTAPQLSGGQVTLSQTQAETVVLNFWFTNCPPCRQEIPELSAFAASNPSVPLYGVSVEQTPPDRLAALSERLGVRYPVLRDPSGEIARKYGVSLFPTTVIVHHGAIAAVHQGTIDRAGLEAMVAAAEAAHGH